MEERVFYQGPTHPILHMHRAFTGITLPLCSEPWLSIFFFKRKIKRKFLKVILTWITTLAIRLACEKYGWRIAGGRFRWNALDTNSITKICITSTKLTHFSNTKESGCYSSQNTLSKMTRVRNYNYSENGLRLYLPKFMYYFFEFKLSRSWAVK